MFDVQGSMLVVGCGLSVVSCPWSGPVRTSWARSSSSVGFPFRRRAPLTQRNICVPGPVSESSVTRSFIQKNSSHMNTAKYVKVVGVVLLGVCLASCSTTRLGDPVTHRTRRENGDIARRLLKIEDEWVQLDL